MVEVEAAITETETPKTAKAVSLGQVKSMRGVPDNVNEETFIIENKVDEGEITSKNKKEEPTDTAQAETVNPNISEEQRKAFLKEIFGDENTDIEAIKEKLKPTPKEPSEDEKKKAQSENELRQLKLWVDKGGTPEQYNEIKNIANGDKVELSRKKAISELVAAGFSDAEAKEMMKNEFFQIELDNIEQDFDNDESDEDFEKRKKSLQKKIEYGTKKLESYSSYEQTQAAVVLKGLADAVESNDLEVKQEADISSNVDELISKLPRKQTIELGQYNNVQLAPVEHEVSEDSIKQVAAILRDPAQRNNFFKNQDGTLNLPKLTEVLLNNFELKRAIKGALLEGQTRMTAEIQKTFPARNPYELGVGGAPQKFNGKGAVASAGKVQRVSPQHN